MIVIIQFLHPSSSHLTNDLTVAYRMSPRVYFYVLQHVFLVFSILLFLLGLFFSLTDSAYLYYFHFRIYIAYFCISNFVICSAFYTFGPRILSPILNFIYFFKKLFLAFFIVSWIVISFASCINYAFFSFIPQLCFASTPPLLYVFASRFTHGLSNFPLFRLRFKKAFSGIFGYFITILYCIFSPFFPFFLILFCLFLIVTSFHQVICDFLFLYFLASPLPF